MGTADGSSSARRLGAGSKSVSNTGCEVSRGDCPLQEEPEPPCSLPCSRKIRSEYIIRPSVITSLSLPRTLGLPPPNLPYKFILLKKSKMSVFCESCINELSPRMTEGGKEGEASRGHSLLCVSKSTPNLAPALRRTQPGSGRPREGDNPSSLASLAGGGSAFNTCPFGLQRIRHAAPGNRGPQTEGKEAGKGSFLKRVPPSLFPQWPLPLGWYPARTVFTASQSQVHPCPPHHRTLQSPVTAPLILLRKM